MHRRNLMLIPLSIAAAGTPVMLGAAVTSGSIGVTARVVDSCAIAGAETSAGPIMGMRCTRGTVWQAEAAPLARIQEVFEVQKISVSAFRSPLSRSGYMSGVATGEVQPLIISRGSLLHKASMSSAAEGGTLTIRF